MAFPNPRSNVGVASTLNAIKRLLIKPRGKIGASSANLTVGDLDAEPSYPQMNPRKSDVLGVMDQRIGRMGAGVTYRRLVFDPSAADEVFADILFATTDLEDDWDALPDGTVDGSGTDKFTADLAYPAGFTRVHDDKEGAMWDAFRAAEGSVGRF